MRVRRGISRLWLVFTVLVATVMAIQIVPVHAEPIATLAAPIIMDKSLKPSSTFSINITIANVSALFSYMFKLSYDTSLLTATAYVSYYPFEQEWPSEINDPEGYVAVAYGMPLPEYTGLYTTEPYPIARIDFTVKKRGSSLLDLHDTVLSDIYGEIIAHDVRDGFFANIRTEVPDILVTTVAAYPTDQEPSNASTSLTESQDSPRWHAGILLNETTTAKSISASAHIYKNFINSSSDMVAFHIAVARVYIYGGKYTEEWLEVGFFQDRSGFYLYAASRINSTYEESDPLTTDPLTDHFLEIVEISLETFEARIDGEPMKNVTFSSEMYPERWYSAEGESTNQGINSLRGHFWDLKWYDSDGVSHIWSEIEPYKDDPYSVGFPDGSTNEFYTSGGGVLGDVNGDGKVNPLDVGQINAYWYFPPVVGLLGYDSNADIYPVLVPDGRVDIFDLALVNAHWEEEAG